MTRGWGWPIRIPQGLRTPMDIWSLSGGTALSTSISAPPTETVLRTKGDLYIGDQASHTR